jgi:hypothetical protein
VNGDEGSVHGGDGLSCRGPDGSNLIIRSDWRGRRRCWEWWRRVVSASVEVVDGRSSPLAGLVAPGDVVLGCGTVSLLDAVAGLLVNKGLEDYCSALQRGRRDAAGVSFTSWTCSIVGAK